MEKITLPQIKKFHWLLNSLKLMALKLDFVYEFSGGEAVSTKDLTKDQATRLIRALSKLDPLDKMRKKVFALAYEAGIIYGDTWEDKKMNAAKLNKFLVEGGTVKKELGKMNKEELTKTVTQFGQIGKHQSYSKAGKIARSVLSDLNINTTTKPQSKPQ